MFDLIIAIGQQGKGSFSYRDDWWVVPYVDYFFDLTIVYLVDRSLLQIYDGVNERIDLNDLPPLALSRGTLPLLTALADGLDAQSSTAFDESSDGYECIARGQFNEKSITFSTFCTRAPKDFSRNDGPLKITGVRVVIFSISKSFKNYKTSKFGNVVHFCKNEFARMNFYFRNYFCLYREEFDHPK